MKRKYLIFATFILCACCVSCKSDKYPADNVIEQMAEKKLKDWIGAEVDFTPGRDKKELIKLVTVKSKSGDVLALRMTESQIKTLKRILEQREEITVTYDSTS